MSNEKFIDAPEWFYAAPQVCLACGALVHWQYTDMHTEWHNKVGGQA